MKSKVKSLKDEDIDSQDPKFKFIKRTLQKYEDE